MSSKTDRPESSDGAAKAEVPSLEVFLQRLSDTGLMTTDEVQAFVASLPAENRPQSTDEFAREMIRQGKLTKFQAQAICLGKTRGMVVGNYVVHDQLGKGGMGFVYKARHKWMDRVVAIKVLPPSATRSKDAVQRFQREVRAAARLSHPNIVTAYDADESQGVYFLVMEFVDGKDLGKFVKDRGPLGVATAVNYIVQVAQGLEYAHRQGVIHRDIKPANLLLDKGGNVKILDMGLARMDESVGGASVADDDATHAGQIMGTLDYMAPEQAFDTRSADARADIYALGCTLHFLLTGRKPFGGESVTQKIVAHRECAIPSLRAARPDVPEWLDATFQHMLAKRPEDRPQSMTELIAKLQQASLPQTGVAVGVASPAEPAAETLNVEQLQPDTSPPPPEISRATPLPPPSPAPELRMPLVRVGPAPRHKQPWRKVEWWIAAGLGLLIAVLAVIFKLQTRDGTLVVKLSEPNAIVQVLSADDTVEIELKARQEKLTLSVDPGKHRLRLQQNGVVVFSREFTIASGGQETIEAAWEPAPAVKAAVQPKPDRNSQAIATPPPTVTATEPTASAAADLPAMTDEDPDRAKNNADTPVAPPVSPNVARRPIVDQKSAVTVTLQPVHALRNSVAPYRRLASIKLMEKPERPLKAEPKYASARPLYGTLHLGDAADNAVAVVLDEAPGKQPSIYIDRNRDLDLTNDGPAAWSNMTNKSWSLDDVLIDVPYKTGVVPSMFSFSRVAHRSHDRLSYGRDSGREGEFVLEDKRYKILLLDDNNDGRFDDLDNGWWLIDLNQDGKLDGNLRSAERHRLSEPVNIHSKVWQVASVAPDGHLMTVCPSTAQVPMHQYLDPGQPAPVFASPGLDGRPVDLQSEASTARYILLHFWTASPPRIRSDFPAICRLQTQYADRGLKVIGVSLETDREKTLRTVQEASLSNLQVFDGKSTYGEAAVLYRATSGDVGLFDKSLRIMVWGRGVRGVEEQLNSIFADPASKPQESTPKKGEATAASASDRMLHKRIHMTPPYPGLRAGTSLDRILIPNALQEICKQAGITCNLDKTRRAMGGFSQRLIRPDIRGKSVEEALDMILSPLGLIYRIEDSELIVGKK